MNLRKCAGIGVAALAMFAASGNIKAADLLDDGVGSYKDVPLMPDWNGFYMGINGGYGWADNDNYGYDEDLVNGFAGYDGVGADGGFGGFQIGYNSQGALFGFQPLLLGFEADIQGADFSDTDRDTYGITYKRRLGWFGTVRGRIGYAMPTTLLYFTGGFAYGGLKGRIVDYSVSPENVYSESFNVSGGVLGGGIEYKMGPHTSVKIEYQYLDFGQNNPKISNGGVTPASANAAGFDINDDTFHTVRIGLNYDLNPDYVPLK